MAAGRATRRRDALPGLLAVPNQPGATFGHGPLLVLALLLVIIGIVGTHVLSVGHHAPTAAHAVAPAHDVGGPGAQITHDHHESAVAFASGSEPADLECGPGCSDGLASTSASCMLALTLLLVLGRPRQLAQRVDEPGSGHRLAGLVALSAHRPLPRPPSLTALCVLRI